MPEVTFQSPKKPRSVEILNCINMEGISIFTISKETFMEDSITIALLHRVSFYVSFTQALWQS